MVIKRGENMSVLFLQYPKCTTCKKAKKWLDDNNHSYEGRHIVEANPSVEELTKWINESGLPVKRFFNTSGMLYREMNLKDKVKTASDEELIELLATNGMLVKRPLLITDKGIYPGFKEEEWEKLI